MRAPGMEPAIPIRSKRRFLLTFFCASVSAAGFAHISTETHWSSVLRESRSIHIHLPAAKR